jgi:hypothetical protein
MKRAIVLSVILLMVSSIGWAQVEGMELESFKIRPITGNEFYSFVEIFGEMRGPLRSQILKDRKKDFEDVDPLKYVMKLKGEKDVVKMLKKYEMDWAGFTDLFGNVMLAYFSIQPDVTKVALIREMADYGLSMSEDQIPREYRDLVKGILKTEEGAALANIALDYFLSIPEQNVAIVKENKLTLDKMFYTRFWKDEIGKKEKG